MSDLLLLKKRDTFIGYKLPEEAAKQIGNSPSVIILGVTYRNEGTCCEWLEVREAGSGLQVGVCLTDFYQSFARPLAHSLHAHNAHFHDREAVILLRDVANYQKEPGPYLPVYCLAEDGGQIAYMIPDGIDKEGLEACSLRYLELTSGIARRPNTPAGIVVLTEST